MPAFDKLSVGLGVGKVGLDFGGSGATRVGLAPNLTSVGSPSRLRTPASPGRVAALSSGGRGSGCGGECGCGGCGGGRSARPMRALGAGVVESRRFSSFKVNLGAEAEGFLPLSGGPDTEEFWLRLAAKLGLPYQPSLLHGVRDYIQSHGCDWMKEWGIKDWEAICCKVRGEHCFPEEFWEGVRQYIKSHGCDWMKAWGIEGWEKICCELTGEHCPPPLPPCERARPAPVVKCGDYGCPKDEIKDLMGCFPPGKGVSNESGTECSELFDKCAAGYDMFKPYKPYEKSPCREWDEHCAGLCCE